MPKKNNNEVKENQVKETEDFLLEGEEKMPVVNKPAEQKTEKKPEEVKPAEQQKQEVSNANKKLELEEKMKKLEEELEQLKKQSLELEEEEKKKQNVLEEEEKKKQNNLQNNNEKKDEDKEKEKEPDYKDLYPNLDKGVAKWYDSLLTNLGGGKRLNLDEEEDRKKLDLFNIYKGKNKDMSDMIDKDKFFSNKHEERNEEINKVFESARKENLYVYNKDDGTLRRATIGPDGKLQLSEDLKTMLPPKKPGMFASKEEKAKYKHEKALFDKENKMFGGKKSQIDGVDLKSSRKQANKEYKEEQKRIKKENKEKELKEMSERAREKARKALEEEKIKEQEKAAKQEAKNLELREKLRQEGLKKDHEYFQKKEEEKLNDNLSKQTEDSFDKLSKEIEEEKQKESQENVKDFKDRLGKLQQDNNRLYYINVKEQEKEKQKGINPENEKYLDGLKDFDPSAVDPKEIGKTVKKLNEIVGTESGLSEETVKAGQYGEKLFGYLKEHNDVLAKCGLNVKDMRNLSGTIELGKIAGEGLDARQRINQGLENVSAEDKKQLINSVLTMDSISFKMEQNSKEMKSKVASGKFDGSLMQNLMGYPVLAAKFKYGIKNSPAASELLNKPEKLNELCQSGKKSMEIKNMLNGSYNNGINYSNKSLQSKSNRAPVNDKKLEKSQEIPHISKDGNAKSMAL